MDCKNKRKVPPFRFNIPEYCNHYKPLLVEEFAFNSSPMLLHYGKCSVIGRTFRDPDTNRLYLGSIRLVGLSRQYQCPDGSNRVALSTTMVDQYIPEGTSIVVFGEAMLLNTSSIEMEEEVLDTSGLLSTSKSLMLSIRQSQIDLEQKYGLPDRCPTGITDVNLHPSVRKALYNEIRMMIDRFEPTISVHSFKQIDQPHSLINANLRLAIVRQQRDAQRSTT